MKPTGWPGNRMRRFVARHICLLRPQSLWKRYLLAFVLIGGMMSASHVTSLMSIHASDGYAELINIAGRQRMLSQRILFYVNDMHISDSGASLAGLEKSVAEFEQAHELLVNWPGLPETLLTLYHRTGPVPLDAFTRRYAAMATYYPVAEGAERINIRDQLTVWGEHDLLGKLNKAVSLLENHSKAQSRRLLHIQHTTFYIAVLIFVLEAALIFLPAQISVSRAISRLERRKKQLSRSYDALRARNSELVSARRTLAHAANHDTLTGLANRRAINEFLSQLPAANTKADITLGVLKIDLDRFKSVNDRLGHAAGDALLQKVASLLRRETSPGDLVGRIGGDEFVVVVTEPASVQAIEDLARRIVDALSEPFVSEGGTCRTGASAGYTLAGSSTATPDQLLIESDLALYEAKRTGRGRAHGYSSELRADIETRNALFSEIGTAIDRDEFEAWMQPQVCAGSLRLAGCEVLVRWNHPTRGIVPPAIFLAAAEQAGLLRAIDMMMLSKGLDQLEELRAAGIDLPKISINASPSTLHDQHLPERLMQEIRSRHLSPQDLVVEVLESTLIESEDDMAARTIARIADAGIAVSLDDFGTGYASMSTLSQLTLSGIKLDQSLISPVPQPRAESIIAALVTMSRSLGMTVVAEGIETQEQLELVAGMGCDTVQGYLIGKPMRAADFHTWALIRHEETAGRRA
ncbi:EAL domain-containing protein [Roseobacter sp.]|uniref:putative bifunctional diguanylate cyclase/phosphodiesterase n=1 Tax=Roseobacter sp. TaxID=1907202 RepID=UPI0025E401FC|nr:EAL domain-containing protein [Roseobacter sp.]